MCNVIVLWISLQSPDDRKYKTSFDENVVDYKMKMNILHPISSFTLIPLSLSSYLFREAGPPAPPHS